MSNFDKSPDNSTGVSSNTNLTRSQSTQGSNSLVTRNNTDSMPRSNSYNPYNSSYPSYNSYSRGYDSGYGGTSDYSDFDNSSGYGGYGGYNSGYGSYGGYGGYSSGYSSYGGSGYSSYGGPNQYSNTYSKPVGPPGSEQQAPPPTVRHDVWGFLNGFHAMLSVLYAATGIVHFGKMFVKMSVKIIKMVFGKSVGLVFKLTGFQFLKKIMEKYSSEINWQTEFNFQDNPMDTVWGTNPEGSLARSFFGKFLLVLRICSLMGALITFFLRRKMNNQPPPPVDVNVITPGDEMPTQQIKIVKLDDLKNFYEEVRGIENELKAQRDQISAVNETIIEKEDSEINEIKIEEVDDQEIEAATPKASTQNFDELESKKDFTTDITDNNLEIETGEEKVTGEAAQETKEVKNDDQENTSTIIIQDETTKGLTMKENTENNVIIEPASQTTPNPLNLNTNKETRMSEDFWRKEEAEKTPENVQEASSIQVEETKKETFVLPTVLQTLRTNSTTPSSKKPWLLKKKMTVETPVEQTPDLQKMESTPNPVIEIKPEVTIDINHDTIEKLTTLENNVENMQ